LWEETAALPAKRKQTLAEVVAVHPLAQQQSAATVQTIAVPLAALAAQPQPVRAQEAQVEAQQRTEPMEQPLVGAEAALVGQAHRPAATAQRGACGSLTPYQRPRRPTSSLAITGS